MSRERDVLRIHLLGGFALEMDGDQLPPLPSRHARLLFAWLALQRGRPQPRTLLADRFWPDLPEARGRRRLSHALWQIQDSIGEVSPGTSYVTTRGDEVAFDVDAPTWLDVEEFEQRLDEVDEAGQVGASTRPARSTPRACGSCVARSSCTAATSSPAATRTGWSPSRSGCGSGTSTRSSGSPSPASSGRTSRRRWPSPGG